MVQTIIPPGARPAGRPKAETGQGELIEPENRLNLDEFKGRRSDDIAAEKAGFGSKDTYRQARKVTEEAIPERQLIFLGRGIDRTGREGGRLKPSR